jgi:hypothetical protein
VDQADADALDNAIHQSIFDSVSNSFDAASNDTFTSLPSQAQTVIADLAIQYGPGLPTATPNFWNDVTSGHWQDAVDELRNFGDAYPTRRNAEANLLQQAIDNGTLPSGN